MPNPVSTILLLVLSAATAAGQTVHRFDMGPASSPLAAGFTAVDRTTA